MPEPFAPWLALAAFVATYAGLAVGRLPWLRTDRPGIALAGAAAVLALGLLAGGDGPPRAGRRRRCSGRSTRR